MRRLWQFRTIWHPVLFLLGLALGASLVMDSGGGFQPWGEYHRWRIASAEAMWLEGDRDEAIERLQQTLAEGSPQLDALFQLTEWALDREQYDVVHWACDQAEAALSEQTASPEQAVLFRRWYFARQRSFAYYRQHQPGQALEVWEPFTEVPELAQLPEFLNGYAYLRSLVGRDLSAARRDIDEALKQYHWTVLDREHRVGLAWFDAEQWSQGAEVLAGARDAFGDQYALFQLEYERDMSRLLSTESPIASEVRAAIHELRRQRENLHYRWALLHAHLALVQDKLEDTDGAAADREVVQQLGYDPEELADLRFKDDDLLGYAALLDTRGWVEFRSGKIQEAVETLEAAVRCADAAMAKLRATSDEERLRLVQVESLDELLRDQRRSLAVLHDHLAQARYESGDFEGAADSEDRVRQLGFSPDDPLY